MPNRRSASQQHLRSLINLRSSSFYRHSPSSTELRKFLPVVALPASDCIPHQHRLRRCPLILHRRNPSRCPSFLRLRRAHSIASAPYTMSLSATPPSLTFPHPLLTPITTKPTNATLQVLQRELIRKRQNPGWSYYLVIFVHPFCVKCPFFCNLLLFCM